MLDLDELRSHQEQGVWRYCFSKTKEFGEKIAVEKWKYLMFESILYDVLGDYPSEETEDAVLGAVLARVPPVIQGELGDAETELRITLLDLEFRDRIVRKGRKRQSAKLRLKVRQQPGVPLHLEKLACNVIQGPKACEFDIACSCENINFEVKYLAIAIFNHGEQITQFTDLKHSHGHLFSFDLYCNHCGRHHVLFDKWAHGWDGFHRVLESGEKTQNGYPTPTAEMSGDYGPPSGALPDPVSFSCPACAGLTHAVHVLIVVDDEFDEFKEHYRGDRSLFKRTKMKDAWNSTFGSIEIGLTCEKCGVERAAISYETA